MKKSVFNWKLTCAALIIAAITTLSSCLDLEESKGNMIGGALVGIVRLDTNTLKNVLDISDFESLYSSTFSNMKEGTCCFILYELNYDDPENSPAKIEENKYYSITVSKCTEANRYPLLTSPNTSSVPLPAETPISDPTAQALGYVKGIVFLNHQLEKPEDQTTEWELSYDLNNPSKSENGYTIYDVYLRATIKNDGKQTPKENFELCAYDMKTHLENAAIKEKGEGKDQIYLRFNYVSKIEKDTATWSQSEYLPIDILKIFPKL